MVESKKKPKNKKTNRNFSKKKCFNKSKYLQSKYDKRFKESKCDIYEFDNIESVVKNMNNILESINNKKNKIKPQQEVNIILKLSYLKKMLIKLCKENKGKYNKKKNECHINISNLLTNINNTFNKYHNNYDNIILIGGNKIPKNNYNIPNGVFGCQGGVNGCNNNQRLIYDSQGIIGCNQPFGTPSQGGQTFQYPEYIISK